MKLYSPPCLLSLILSLSFQKSLQLSSLWTALTVCLLAIIFFFFVLPWSMFLEMHEMLCLWVKSAVRSSINHLPYPLRDTSGSLREFKALSFVSSFFCFVLFFIFIFLAFAFLIITAAAVVKAQLLTSVFERGSTQTVGAFVLLLFEVVDWDCIYKTGNLVTSTSTLFLPLNTHTSYTGFSTF